MSTPDQVTLKALTETLRKVLKQKRINYAEISEKLEVSEQTVKRFFAGDDFPISRILSICDMLEISFFDLAEIARGGAPESYYQLTLEQEEYFVTNMNVFHYFCELRAGTSVEDIAADNGLSESSVRKYLKELEEISLIERHEGNRFETKVTGSQKFIKDGPLSRAIGKEIAQGMQDWVSTPANTSKTDASLWTMSDGSLSLDSLKELKQDLEELAMRYRKRAHREAKILSKDVLQCFAWNFVLATPYEHKFKERIKNF